MRTISLRPKTIGCAAALVLGVLAALPVASASASTLLSNDTTTGSLPSLPTHLVWSDEFNRLAGTPPSPSTWNYDLGGGGWGNGELEAYTSSTANASMDGQGHLAITALKSTTTSRNGRRSSGTYTSARIHTEDKFSTTYGLIEAKMKLPPGTGLWPAFWMIGSNFNQVGWPACGEIDVMEELGQDPFTIYGSLHGNVGNGQDYPNDGLSVTGTSNTSLTSGFHTYGVLWTATSFTYLLDGVPYGTLTKADLPSGADWPFTKPEFLILNLAVGGDWPGSPNSSTPFPATLLVDWVRVYQ